MESTRAIPACCNPYEDYHGGSGTGTVHACTIPVPISTSKYFLSSAEGMRIRSCLNAAFYSGTARDASVFSQVGEDGIIQAAFQCMGTTSKYFVEFGVEDGSQCSTRLLRERHGWTGRWVSGR